MQGGRMRWINEERRKVAHSNWGNIYGQQKEWTKRLFTGENANRKKDDEGSPTAQVDAASVAERAQNWRQKEANQR